MRTIDAGGWVSMTWKTTVFDAPRPPKPSTPGVCRHDQRVRAERRRPRVEIPAGVSADRVRCVIVERVPRVAVVIEANAAGVAGHIAAEVELPADRREIDDGAVDQVETGDRLVEIRVNQLQSCHVGEHLAMLQAFDQTCHREALPGAANGTIPTAVAESIRKYSNNGTKLAFPCFTMPDTQGHHLDEDVLQCIEDCTDCHKAYLQTCVSEAFEFSFSFRTVVGELPCVPRPLITSFVSVAQPSSWRRPS
jgi:hypothetical protein